MSQLNAFVGHSFLQKDEEVVRKYLEYFENLRGVVPGFAWDHAKKAEPKALADKVRKLFEGKNLFIGICTVKEAAVSQEELKPSLFRSKKLVIPSTSVDYKTSDWLLQEIGFALGRGLDLILLVEEGVRRPGGLQGDIEYVPFSRDAPEKSFGRVLQMIQAILPNAQVVANAASTGPSVAEGESSQLATHEVATHEPQDDWSRDQYENRYLAAVAADDEQEASKISEAFRNSRLAEDVEKLAEWEAIEEYWKISFGKNGSLSRIEELAAKYADNSDIQYYIGVAYVKYSMHRKAAECFELAASSVATRATRESYLRHAAMARSRLGDCAGEKRLIEEIKSIVSKGEQGELVLLSALKELTNTEKNIELWIGLNEAILERRPDKISERFSLAYKYSQNGQRQLSLWHYLKIPAKDRGSAAWNNLGVEYEHSKMNSRSTKAYRKSEKMGETLAASNLANKLISIGFLEEAKGMCMEAMSSEDCDTGVARALTRIGDIPEEERESLKEIVEESKEMREYWVEFGNAALGSDLRALPEVFDGPNGAISIEITDDKFTGTKRYEVGPSGLFNALSIAPSIPNRKKTFEVTYKGVITGRSVTCDCTRKLVNGPKSPQTILGNSDDDSFRCILYVNDPNDRINVCERPLTKQVKFESWIKSNT